MAGPGYQLALRHGRLVITFRTSAYSAQIILNARALDESTALQREAASLVKSNRTKRRRKRTLRMRVLIGTADSLGGRARVSLIAPFR